MNTTFRIARLASSRLLPAILFLLAASTMAVGQDLTEAVTIKIYEELGVCHYTILNDVNQGTFRIVPNGWVTIFAVGVDARVHFRDGDQTKAVVGPKHRMLERDIEATAVQVRSRISKETNHHIFIHCCRDLDAPNTCRSPTFAFDEEAEPYEPTEGDDKEERPGGPRMIIED